MLSNLQYGYQYGYGGRYRDGDTAALRLASGWDIPADDANGTRRSNIVYSSDVDTSNGIHNGVTHTTNGSLSQQFSMNPNGSIRGVGGGRGGRGSKRRADDSDLRYDQVKTC